MASRAFERGNTGRWVDLSPLTKLHLMGEQRAALAALRRHLGVEPKVEGTK